MMAKLIATNMAEFKRNLDAADKTRAKAGQTSVKVEGFRLKNLLTAEIREGAPGRRGFSPLSEIARHLRRGRKSPLYALAKVIRYRTDVSGNDLHMQIGFVDPNRGAALSKSWKRIARFMQEGFSVPADQPVPGASGEAMGGMSYRQYFLYRASLLGSRSKFRKYLFLLKSTRTLKTPARPIIEPFWRAHKAEAERNIARNFERKMRGERI